MQVEVNAKRYKMSLSREPGFIILTFLGLDDYCANDVTLEDVPGNPFTAEELIAEIELIQEKPEVYKFV